MKRSNMLGKIASVIINYNEAGCINVDGGMSPSWLFIPGVDIEIIEKVKDDLP